MAEKIIIDIEARLSNVERDMKKVAQSTDQLNTNVRQTNTALETTNNVAKRATKALSGIGLAIKAMGIGLLLEGFAMFKQIMGENQKVADLFRKTFLTIQTLFNKLVDVVVPLGEQLFALFNDPQESIKQLGTFIKNYVLNYFRQWVDMIKHTGEGMVKLFRGDFKGALESAMAVGEDFTDMWLGAEGATGRMVDKAKQFGNELRTMVADSIELGDELLRMENALKMSEAIYQKEQAERMREFKELAVVADDINRLTTERIRSLERQQAILDESAEAELAIMNQKIALAQVDLQLTDNIDNRVKLIQLETERSQFLAMLEERRKESANKLNMLRRQDTLELAKQAKMLDDDLRSLDAYVDDSFASLEELEVRKTEWELALQDLREQGRLKQISGEWEALQVQDEINRARYEREMAFLNEQQALYVGDAAKHQEILAKKKTLDEQYGQASAEVAMKTEMLKRDAIAGTVATALSVLTKFDKSGKASAIANAIWNTFQGATKALATYPPPFNFIAMGATIASGLLQVANIKKTNPNQSSAPSPTVPHSSAGAGIKNITAPSVSILGGGGMSQLSELMGSTLKTTNKSYVVSQDVTSQQALDRRLIQNATFGGN